MLNVRCNYTQEETWKNIDCLSEAVSAQHVPGAAMQKQLSPLSTACGPVMKPEVGWSAPCLTGWTLWPVSRSPVLAWRRMLVRPFLFSDYIGILEKWAIIPFKFWPSYDLGILIKSAQNLRPIDAV